MSLSDYSKTVVTLVKITLPYCGNTFGVAPCTAVGTPVGTPCYNTYHTCGDRANYNATAREYKFCSADAPLPFPGPRPYVKSISYLPTEITTNLTKTGRVKIEFNDEPDSDIGIDPYVTQRSAWPDIPGTFFRKLIARNPNYKGAACEILEGCLGDNEASFVRRAAVLLETGKIGKGTFAFESVDLLAGLGEIETPRATDLKLLADITAGDSVLTLAATSDAASLAASGYLLIDDEVIGYSAYDSTQHTASGLTRGAFGTVADSHGADTAVQPCRYFAPGNPFDHLKAMLLTDAAYNPALVDAAAFDAWRDWPGGEVDMSALITEPTKLDELYMGLVNLLDCKSWVAENLKLTIARNISNMPGREYVAWDDDQSIIKSSGSSELNEESRQTRCALYWEKSALGKPDEVESYSRIDVGVNAEAETEYGDTRMETLFAPWLTAAGIQPETMAYYLSDTLLRRMFNKRDAAALLSVSVDLKDGASAVGTFITLTTDELNNPDGTPVTTRFQVVKREPKGSKIDYKLQRMPARRCLFYAPEGVTNYATASAAEQEYGGFYCDDHGRMPDGSAGFFYY